MKKHNIMFILSIIAILFATTIYPAEKYTVMRTLTNGHYVEKNPMEEFVMTNVKHSPPCWKLKGLTLNANLKIESDKNEYDFTLGLKWQMGNNSLYTRAKINNNEDFNTISILGKYDITMLLGKFLYPFIVMDINSFSDYGTNKISAWRILWGVGIGLKMPIFNWLSASLDSGLNVTHEIDTGLPKSIVWQRNRARLTFKFFKLIDIHADAVVSIPISSNINKWYDYIATVEFKIAKNISLVTQLRFYDHKILNETNSIEHKISLKVKI